MRQQFKQLKQNLKLWWEVQTDRVTGKTPPGFERSSSWRYVRDLHLIRHPKCACCGGTKKLRVHHIKPFQHRPELELDPDNLITLCESKRFGINCHLLVGHLGNWSHWNPFVRIDAVLWNKRITGRCREVAAALHDDLIEEDGDENGDEEPSEISRAVDALKAVFGKHGTAASGSADPANTP